MESSPEQLSVAHEMWKRYNVELKRLHAQQRGVEQKIAATEAKIEAAREIMEEAKKLGMPPVSKDGPEIVVP